MIPGRKVIRAISFFGIISLFGCAAHQAYDGPKLPSDKVAVVNGVTNILPGTTSLSISSVDGKPLSPYQGSIEVLPGKHVIGVQYHLHAGGGIFAKGEVTVETQAGKTYQLDSKSDGGYVTFSGAEVANKK